jgi:plasmid stabilization system protein ParE
MRYAPATDGMRSDRTHYYRIAGDDLIDVVRVIHKRMDVDRQFD